LFSRNLKEIKAIAESNRRYFRGSHPFGFKALLEAPGNLGAEYVVGDINL